MKEKFLNAAISFLKKYNNYSERDLLKLRYGLEGIYLTFTKLIIILVVAFILGILKEVLIVLVLFNILRFFGFGFHAEKSYECLILSLFNFIAIPFFFINLDISLSVSLIIAGICVISYLLFAPADTVKRPLPNKKKRLIRKVLTVLTGLVYTIVIVIFNRPYTTSLILSSLVIQFIVVSPLTYKIFRQPYNNYKNLA